MLFLLGKQATFGHEPPTMHHACGRLAPQLLPLALEYEVALLSSERDHVLP